MVRISGEYYFLNTRSNKKKQDKNNPEIRKVQSIKNELSKYKCVSEIERNTRKPKEENI